MAAAPSAPRQLQQSEGAAAGGCPAEEGTALGMVRTQN